MEFIIDSFEDGPDFILVGVKSEQDMKKKVESMVNGMTAMATEGMDPKKAEKIKSQLKNSFMTTFSDQEEIEIYQIPMEKAHFEEAELKLGEKVDVQLLKIEKK